MTFLKYTKKILTNEDAFNAIGYFNTNFSNSIFTNLKPKKQNRSHCDALKVSL